MKYLWRNKDYPNLPSAKAILDTKSEVFTDLNGYDRKFKHPTENGSFLYTYNEELIPWTKVMKVFINIKE